MQTNAPVKIESIRWWRPPESRNFFYPRVRVMNPKEPWWIGRKDPENLCIFLHYWWQYRPLLCSLMFSSQRLYSHGWTTDQTSHLLLIVFPFSYFKSLRVCTGLSWIDIKLSQPIFVSIFPHTGKLPVNRICSSVVLSPYLRTASFPNLKPSP